MNTWPLTKTDACTSLHSHPFTVLSIGLRGPLNLPIAKDKQTPLSRMSGVPRGYVPCCSLSLDHGEKEPLLPRVAEEATNEPGTIAVTTENLFAASANAGKEERHTRSED